jgi:hypothetical protein
MEYFSHTDLVHPNVQGLRYPAATSEDEAFLDVEVVSNGNEADDVKSCTPSDLVFANISDDSKKNARLLAAGTRVYVERESLFDDKARFSSHRLLMWAVTQRTQLLAVLRDVCWYNWTGIARKHTQRHKMTWTKMMMALPKS